MINKDSFINPLRPSYRSDLNETKIRTLSPYNTVSFVQDIISRRSEVRIQTRRTLLPLPLSLALILMVLQPLFNPRP